MQLKLILIFNQREVLNSLSRPISRKHRYFYNKNMARLRRKFCLLHYTFTTCTCWKAITFIAYAKEPVFFYINILLKLSYFKQFSSLMTNEYNIFFHFKIGPKRQK